MWQVGVTAMLWEMSWGWVVSLGTRFAGVRVMEGWGRGYDLGAGIGSRVEAWGDGVPEGGGGWCIDVLAIVVG